MDSGRQRSNGRMKPDDPCGVPQMMMARTYTELESWIDVFCTTATRIHIEIANACCIASNKPIIVREGNNFYQ